jgi:hypothetical protein
VSLHWSLMARCFDCARINSFSGCWLAVRLSIGFAVKFD